MSPSNLKIFILPRENSDFLYFPDRFHEDSTTRAHRLVSRSQISALSTTTEPVHRPFHFLLCSSSQPRSQSEKDGQLCKV